MDTKAYAHIAHPSALKTHATAGDFFRFLIGDRYTLLEEIITESSEAAIFAKTDSTFKPEIIIAMKMKSEDESIATGTQLRSQGFFSILSGRTVLVSDTREWLSTAQFDKRTIAAYTDEIYTSFNIGSLRTYLSRKFPSFSSKELLASFPNELLEARGSFNGQTFLIEPLSITPPLLGDEFEILPFYSPDVRYGFFRARIPETILTDWPREIIPQKSNIFFDKDNHYVVAFKVLDKEEAISLFESSLKEKMARTKMEIVNRQTPEKLFFKEYMMDIKPFEIMSSDSEGIPMRSLGVDGKVFYWTLDNGLMFFGDNGIFLSKIVKDSARDKRASGFGPFDTCFRNTETALIMPYTSSSALSVASYGDFFRICAVPNN